MEKKRDSKKSNTQKNKALAAALHGTLLTQYLHDDITATIKRGLNLPDDLSLRSMRSDDLLKVCSLNGTATITIKINGGSRNRLVKATG